MINWTRLAPISRFYLVTCRFYTRKIISTSNSIMKQIHQQTLRYVCPNANIKIDSDIRVKVSSVDPQEYPNGDAFIAKLIGGPAKNCTASMLIKVSDNERDVEVILRKLTECTDFHCELLVPIKAGIDINSRHEAHVENTYGDEVKVRGNSFINIKNIRAEKIELLCSNGDIRCQGLLLGKYAQVETKNKGDIYFDKLQGDKIICKTTQGNITTNCSYMESSEFQTDTGVLDLKNVHKKTAIYVHRKGDLKMSGVHGNLKVLMNEGTMYLQLSELHGENTIEVNNLSSCVINISEDIEKTTALDVSLVESADTSTISLDRTLDHLLSALTDNNKKFKINDEIQSVKLKVVSRSSLTLAKSSWMDAMHCQIKKKQEEK